MYPKIIPNAVFDDWAEVSFPNELGSFSLFTAKGILWTASKVLPESWLYKLIIKFQEIFVNRVSNKKKANTFGGFLENRAKLIGFLEEEACTNNMTHLGIDINNLEAKTDVYAPCDLTVVHVFKDHSKINGWGGRLIMEMKENYKNCKYLLYGHLSPENLPEIGQTFKAGEIVGQLGDTTENGGWFIHLHVQCITEKFYNDYANDLTKLDGYLFEEEIDYFDYVADPTDLVFVKL